VPVPAGTAAGTEVAEKAGAGAEADPAVRGAREAYAGVAAPAAAAGAAEVPGRPA
jgi:hypothetical protein